MADKGGKDEERDPFEDLDQFFAPIEEGDEPEDLPSSPREEPEDEPAEVSHEEAAEAIEDLEVNIDLPDESDLVEGLPEEEAAPAPPAAETEGPTDLEQTSEMDVETGGDAGGEWDRLRAETLAGGGEAVEEPAAPTNEPTTIPELGPDLEGYPGLPTEPEVEVEADEQAAAAAEFADVGDQDQPDPAAVEAAAEHFASGMRQTPEEVERELLSDLDDGTGTETVRIEPTAPVAGAPTWQEGGEPVGTEGPSWQEGGQPVVTEEPPAAATEGRNVPAALVSGLLLGAAVLALLAVNKGAFVFLAAAAILLSQAELYAVMRMRGLQPATLLGLVCGAFTFVGAYLHGESAAMLGLVIAMGLTVPWYIAVPASARKHTTANVAATILGVVYVPFLASFAMILLRTPETTVSSGKYMFLAMLVLTVAYDVVAYAVGTVWGHRPLAPTVSPNKSWEGALGGTLVILIIGMAVLPAFVPFENRTGVAVGLALVIAVFAPLGDLVESAFKRDLGVKDMGSLLPGHGGVLDRVDAILFAAPAAYFFLRIALG
ncbi:MAG: phosphatidate cytidylyltransferase [Actinomycetota bacterium]